MEGWAALAFARHRCTAWRRCDVMLGTWSAAWSYRVSRRYITQPLSSFVESVLHLSSTPSARISLYTTSTQDLKLPTLPPHTNTNNQPIPPLKMCLPVVSSSPKKQHRHRYVEEVYVAPRPVSRHSHNHYGGGRSSYTSVTRTSRPASATYYAAPRMSQNSYRRSGPIIVEERRNYR